MTALAKKLNLTTRILEDEPLPVNPKVEQRLSINFMSEVIRIVNDRLLLGLNTPTDAERISVKEKTDSNYNRETISTDTISA